MHIEIPEPLLKRLQKHATPFIDTPVTVIERWANFYEEHFRESSSNGSAIQTNSNLDRMHVESVLQFDPKRPPSLLHTRVRGEFSGIPYSNWNDLVRIAHIEAFKKKARTFEGLRSATRAQIKMGNHSTEGYRFVPEINISIQGVDADRAWEYSLRLAIYLNDSLTAEVEWRENDKAAYPGQRGMMSWIP